MNPFNFLFLLIAGGVLSIASLAALIQGRASFKRTQWTHFYVLGLSGAAMLAMAAYSLNP